MRAINKSLIRQLLASNGFLQVNKLLAKHLGMSAALMLAELIFQEEMAINDGRISKDGTFTVFRDTFDCTLLSKNSQLKAEGVLVSHKILQKTTNSNNAGNSYKLDIGALEKLMQSWLK